MLLEQIASADSLHALTGPLGITALLVGLLVIQYVIPYAKDPNGLNKFPGPVVSRFSNLWMLFTARMHVMSVSVHKLHQQHGDFVRLSPNHLSVNHPDSVRDIMGHGNGFTKSEFYYAFDNIEQGIFTTRDRAKHSRKRKFVAHMFSSKSMVEFEPYTSSALLVMGAQIDKMIDTGKAGDYIALDRTDPKIAALKRKGEIALDAVTWASFLAFDIIGDLAFDEPFGFCKAGADKLGGVMKLRDRGEWCSTVGQVPWIKTWTPYFFFDPFFIRGRNAAAGLAEIGINSVEKRKNKPSDPSRRDILYYLLSAKDPDTGGPLPDRELKAEALTQLIAGSDTTGNSLAQIIDLLVRHPNKMAKLIAELDEQYPAPSPADFVSLFADCQNLPYLQACICEVLRLRTVTSMGLPRAVGASGANVCGHFFPEGTILSVPTYTVHRDPRRWGDNALEFEPERWLGGTQAELEKHFLAFSFGPRACIGRNVAFMEVKKTVATLFRRFSLRAVYPDRQPCIREGFHNKCDESFVFMSRRD
ncbi:cytochrome P450 monooxygenase pc-bph [Penicillium cinerascens]|uniref:Cytochrome P450 monooxygenase pc-bph n=1 Tax=Penicillium cinerascens TaxID=70096 RepID=A0A9W9TCQ0_9EURO|nr:cytochrome P450 monooxygenase pc-bph [Penicillium cinerascens]KAJ5217937.1 cytochrome P450 monooxygenase pc-bph [Penicillium cinerascens]